MDWLNKGLDWVKGKADTAANDVAAGYDNLKEAISSNIEKQPWMTTDDGRTTFDSNKYTIGQHSYPEDLMTEQYGGNYVVFYINISDESKLAETQKLVTLDPKIEPRYRNKYIAQPLSVNEVVLAAGTSGAAEGAIGGGAKGGLKTGVLATVGTGAIGTFAPKNTRSYRRMDTAIALHVPNQLSVRYGMQWSEEDTAALQAGAVADSLLGALANKGAVNKQATAGAEAAASLAMSKLPNSGAVSTALGIAANPKKEQTFKGVDYRKFSFEYQFFPRSSNEARNVLKIIETFKLHMHPEFKSENQFIYIYPSEFDIIYYHGYTENKNIHRHTSCVLEELNVNYTPNGGFTAFADGMPTQINITLGFRELMLLSKETVNGGF